MTRRAYSPILNANMAQAMADALATLPQQRAPNRHRHFGRRRIARIGMILICLMPLLVLLPHA